MPLIKPNPAAKLMRQMDIAGERFYDAKRNTHRTRWMNTFLAAHKRLKELAPVSAGVILDRYFPVK